MLHADPEHQGKSNIIFLPIIDLLPSDYTCIYSTLKYLCNLAHNNKLHSIITFDQPIFWKASEIIGTLKDELGDIILMLCPFHTFMNLIVVIGDLMSGSGLDIILQQAFGENAVIHMLTEKAVDRPFRRHLIVDTCLNYQLCSLLEENGEISKEKDSKICKLLDFSLPFYNTIIALNEPDIHRRLGDQCFKSAKRQLVSIIKAI